MVLISPFLIFEVLVLTVSPLAFRTIIFTLVGSFFSGVSVVSASLLLRFLRDDLSSTASSFLASSLTQNFTLAELKYLFSPSNGPPSAGKRMPGG